MTLYVLTYTYLGLEDEHEVVLGYYSTPELREAAHAYYLTLTGRCYPFDGAILSGERREDYFGRREVEVDANLYAPGGTNG